MSGGSSQPTQTTRTDISPEAQQLFQTAYPAIAQFAANPPPARYPGSTVAGFTPAQEQAQASAVGAAGTQADIASRANALAAGIPGTLDYSSTGLPGTYAPPQVTGTPTAPTLSSNIFSDPGIWNPAANPGLTAAIEAAQRPTWEALTQTALPAVRHAAISQGPYGGTREALAESRAVQLADRQASDTAAQMANAQYGANLQATNARYNTNVQALMQQYGIDANTATALAGMGVTARGQDIGAAGTRYGQNIQALTSVLGLTPTLQGAQTVPATTLGAVGDVQQQMNQAQLNDAINNYYYSQYAPYLQARDILSLIPSVPGATTVSTGNTPTANPGQQALGGALAGASIGATAFPGVGALPGAAVGAVLPFAFNR